jgi:hypothetical protein
MNKNLPIYEISIDLNDAETTVSFNSLVANPAHEKMFQMFEKQKERWTFSDEEQIITGVAIEAEMPIYRNQQGHEFYVVFTKQAIKDIVFDYARKGNFNNVNLDHNSNKVVDGAYMVMMYQIDEAKGFTAPERFKDSADGSLLVSYKITDKDVWERAKNREVNGFSIEGTFQLEDSEQTFVSELLQLLKQIK